MNRHLLMLEIEREFALNEAGAYEALSDLPCDHIDLWRASSGGYIALMLFDDYQDALSAHEWAVPRIGVKPCGVSSGRFVHSTQIELESHCTTGAASFSFKSTGYNPVTKNPNKKGYVQLHTTHGDLKIELHCDITPRACENFITLCEQGYYDGVSFCRSKRDLLILGGDPTGTGTGGQSIWGKPFDNEFDERLSHCRRGVVSVAEEADNNGSMFFILYKRANHLDGKYTVFGWVVDGLTTLSAMEEVPVDVNFRPLEEIKINSVTVHVNPYTIPDEDEKTEELYKAEDKEKAKQHLALLCLGEIGRRKDLSFHAHIQDIVIEYFQSPSKEIKSAASYALGNIAVGNMSKYLPLILDQIDHLQKKHYLLLHSLKEVIVRQSVDKAEFQEPSVDMILNFLLNHSGSEEEGVRDIVAECLGKIALIEQSKLVAALKMRTTSPNAFTRATVVIAIKYALVEWPEKLDGILYPEISSFLMLIKDGDRHVRRAAVLALSTAAHNKPNLIKGLLPKLLPLLYLQTGVKFRRTVYLGAYKDVVDDGLELRKAAFECVDTLLDDCLDQINPSSFLIPYLKSGLDDHYDVKMLCHRIISKLTDKCPSAVLAVLESLVDPLQKTISFRPKQNALKREVDRNETMIRSALRAIEALNHISGGDCSIRISSLMSDRLSNADHLSVIDYLKRFKSNN